MSTGYQTYFVPNQVWNPTKSVEQIMKNQWANTY